MDGSHSTLPPETRRRRFTAADVQAMLEAGILKNGEKVELIGGELVEMSPQGTDHWRLTARIVRKITRILPEELAAAPPGPLRLGTDNEPEPELYVYPAEMDPNAVRGQDALLVVEVSDSSLRYDLNVKGPLYAACSVREYWVVDVNKRRTLVHRLSDGVYTDPASVSFDAPLILPGGASLVIADLEPKS